jgi:hypothetical protein
MHTTHNHTAALATLGLPCPTTASGKAYKGARAIALAYYLHNPTAGAAAGAALAAVAGRTAACWQGHYNATVRAVQAGLLHVPALASAVAA